MTQATPPEPIEFATFDQAVAEVETARQTCRAAEAKVQTLVAEAEAALRASGAAQAAVGAARAEADAAYLTMQRARDGLTQAVDGLTRIEMADAIVRGQQARQHWQEQSN